MLEPYERSTGDTVRFAQISDIETDTMTAWIPFFHRAVLEQHCAFAILTGDHCRRDGLEFNARLVNSQTMGLSMYNTLGNHDFVKNEDDPPHGEWCFEKHFGPLFGAEPGMEVYFSTVDGRVYKFVISNVEEVDPHAIDYMTKPNESGGWDLTLFTCFLGGRSRCTVRCVSV